MTGPEHYRAAEQLVAEHEAIKSHGLYTITPTRLTIAQIHATLAHAAATALGGPRNGMRTGTREEWASAAGGSQWTPGD